MVFHRASCHVKTKGVMYLINFDLCTSSPYIYSRDKFKQRERQFLKGSYVEIDRETASEREREREEGTTVVDRVNERKVNSKENKISIFRHFNRNDMNKYWEQ